MPKPTKIVITDPRNYRLADDTDLTEKEAAPQLLDRKQLLVWIEMKDRRFDYPSFLFSALQRFPSDLIFTLHDSANAKEEQQMSDCIAPDRLRIGSIGISGSSAGQISRISECFRRKVPRYTWILAVLTNEQFPSLKESIENGLVFANDKDPVGDFVEYSIEWNGDYGQMYWRVYEEKLYDEVIRFVESTFPVSELVQGEKQQ